MSATATVTVATATTRRKRTTIAAHQPDERGFAPAGAHVAVGASVGAVGVAVGALVFFAVGPGRVLLVCLVAQRSTTNLSRKEAFAGSEECSPDDPSAGPGC